MILILKWPPYETCRQRNNSRSLSVSTESAGYTRKFFFEVSNNFFATQMKFRYGKRCTM